MNFTVIQWSVKSNKDLIELWEEPVVSCGVLDGGDYDADGWTDG